jgi:putative membrane protein
MGVVELVPGVSGGTMALVLGIYGELINAIDATFAWIGRRLHRLLPGRYGSAVRGNAPPISFLALLVAGMAVALLAGSHVVTALLDTARGPTYAFFCGLVLASVATPLRLMERRGPAEVAVILCAAAASFLATDLRAAEAGTPTLPFLLVCGALAVAVLVLPGVSGSFVLLALGSYRYVIGRVRGLTAGEIGDSVLPLAVFGIGVVLGLATVTRLISWLLARHRSLTLAALTGLMLGSVRALVPLYRDGQAVPLREVGTMGVDLVPLAIAGAAGAGVVIVMSRAVRHGGTGSALPR